MNIWDSLVKIASNASDPAIADKANILLNGQNTASGKREASQCHEFILKNSNTCLLKVLSDPDKDGNQSFDVYWYDSDHFTGPKFKAQAFKTLLCDFIKECKKDIIYF